MKPAKLNLNIYRGDDYSNRLTFMLPDGVTPIDVSEFTFASQVRPWEDSNEAEAFTIDTTDAASGVLVMTMSKALTETLFERGVWDFQATDTGGIVVTWLKGFVFCNKDVTR